MPRRALLAASLAAALGAGTAGVLAATAASGQTTNYPADKMTVAASGLDDVQPGQQHPVLQATMRTSNVEDLVFSVSEECDIYTSVTNAGSDTTYAFGQVKMHITIDSPTNPSAGVVLVSPDDATSADPGRVVFCNRAHQATSMFLPNESYSTFIQTRDANAFNWVAANVGAGIHTITLWATYDESTTMNGVAKAVVGKRSMVVAATTQAQNQAT